MSDLKPSSLKVVELRAELSKRSLPTKGKKDELVTRLAEALEAEENNSSNSEQAIEEPVEKEQESVEQEQIAEKQPTDVSQSSDKGEGGKVTEQPAEQLIEKPQEQLVEKPQEQLIEKPQEQLIEKPQEQLIEKPQEQLIEKPQEQLIEKPQEQLIEKPQEQLTEKKAGTMETDGDSRLKRKRLENNIDEEEKRLKTDNKKEETAEEASKETAEEASKETSEEASKETSALYIKGFVRPLIIKHVQELFAKYGTVKRFWMDSIKTHCYVTYETKLQAKEAFSNVNGIKFPADTGRLLTVGELTSEQADKLIEYEQNAAEKRIKVDWESMINKIKSGEKLTSSASSNDDSRRFRSIGIGQITKQLAQAAEPNINSSSSSTTATPKSLPPVQHKQKEISLDDLFKKTKSLPQLYYLPNTDQEAKIKLEKLQH